MKYVPFNPRIHPEKWELFIHNGTVFDGNASMGAYIRQLLWTMDQCQSIPTNVLEIGFGYGASALLWLEETDANVTVIEVVEKERWSEDETPDKDGNICYLTKAVDKALKSHGDRFKVIPGRGSEIAATLEQEYDFIFIDSSHIYQDTLDEILACWRLTVPGGMLAGHDIFIPDVRKAVDEASRQLGNIDIQSDTKHQHMGTWYVRR